jgi:hypothetical protein
VAVNLRLPAKTLTRLKVHSFAVGKSASDVVATLIEENLRSYDLVPKSDEGGPRRSTRGG